MKEGIRYIRHLALLLAAVLMVACSDSQEPESPEVDILSRFNSEGKAWMTLQIPLGGQSMTRTTFDDGLDDEWRVKGDELKVKDAYILIFAGANESAAKFASAYKVESPTLNTSAYSQITATATITISDANINTGDKLYVFALLNNNSSAITDFSSNSITFANGTNLTGGSSLVSDLSDITIGSIKDDNGNFLMTNATLANGNTTSASLFHLPEIAASYFFPTEEQSRQNPAGHVNVERLAVKTTVESGLGSGTHNVLGNEYAKFVNDDLTFALDNYNTKSYAYRHLSAVSYQRFVESLPVEPYYPLVYRTYWGEDVNYADGVTTNFTNYTNLAPSWKAMGANDYCAENTFDVAHMQDNCTTSVLVRLQLNYGGDFYTTSVTGSDIVFQSPGYTLEEQGTSASSSFARTRSDSVTYDGANTVTIDEYLRQWLMETNSGFRNWVNTYAAGEVKHVVITLTNDAATGTATVSSVTQTARASGTTGATAFDALGLDSYFASNISLKYYASGYCYYRVLIRHFDDTQTPWSSVSTMTNNSTAQVYGGNAASYLGRYGVVRNNWYNISITSVSHVGSPIIPALTSDADDKVPQFLNATLSINGWTSHGQNL